MSFNSAILSDRNLELFKGLINLEKLTELTLNFYSATIENDSFMDSTFGYVSMLPKLKRLDLSFSNSSL